MSEDELRRGVAALRVLLTDDADPKPALEELRIVTRNAATPVLTRFLEEEEDLDPAMYQNNSETFAVILALGLASMLPPAMQSALSGIINEWAEISSD